MLHEDLDTVILSMSSKTARCYSMTTRWVRYTATLPPRRYRARANRCFDGGEYLFFVALSTFAGTQASAVDARPAKRRVDLSGAGNR